MSPRPPARSAKAHAARLGDATPPAVAATTPGVPQEPLADRQTAATLEAAEAIVRLDPRSIRASVFANRHPRSFTSREFDQLRASIATVGTNLQAIKVRPIVETSDAAHFAFEVVFGHRRHRACLELGIPVAAVIASMSDRELFVQMDRENRTQRPLSALEQGLMFVAALEAGLYASARAMAQDLEVDPSLVSKALMVARLPNEVLQAFASPLDIQYRWAGPLAEAHRSDPAALLARARLLHAALGKFSSVQVFQRLVAASRESQDAPHEISGIEGRASVAVDRRGRLQVLIEPPWKPTFRAQLESALSAVLNRR